MSALQNATDHLTLGAYATVGVLDSTRKQAIELAGRRDELPKELTSLVETRVSQIRTQVTETVEELRTRLEAQRKDTRKRVEGYAGQGKVIVTDLRGNADEAFGRVRETTTKAVSEVREGDLRGAYKVASDAVATELKVSSPKEAGTKVARKAEAKTLTASQLNKKTKAELLDLASAEDVTGRSNMTKAELVKALS